MSELFSLTHAGHSVLVWLKWAKIELEVGGLWMQVSEGWAEQRLCHGFRRTVLVGAQGGVCTFSWCRAGGAEWCGECAGRELGVRVPLHCIAFIALHCTALLSLHSIALHLG